MSSDPSKSESGMTGAAGPSVSVATGVASSGTGSVSDNSGKKAAANKKKREKAKQKKAEGKKAAIASEGKSSLDTEESRWIRDNFSHLSMHEFFKSSMKMIYQPQKGRQIVAVHNLFAGSTIFEIAPYASVVLDEDKEVLCHRCFQTSTTPLYVCSKCKFVRFCSINCKNALSTIHAEECEALTKLQEINIEGESAKIRMLIRILYQRELERKREIKNLKLKEKGMIKKEHDIYKVKPGLSWMDCAGLISHYEEFSRQEQLEIESSLSSLQSIFTKVNEKDKDHKDKDKDKDEKSKSEKEKENKEIETVWPGAKDATKILLQVQCNAHNIVNDQKKRIGIGLYIPAAHLNHSCNPTCVYHWDNEKLIMKTIRPVAEGEELTYAYVDLYQTRRERNIRLSQAYKIQKCSCERCSVPYQTSTDRYLDGFMCITCKELLKARKKKAEKNMKEETKSEDKKGEAKDEDEEEEEDEEIEGIDESKAKDYELHCSKCSKAYPYQAYLDIIIEGKAVIDSGLQLYRMGEYEEASDYLNRLQSGRLAEHLHPFHVLRFNSMCALIDIHRALKQPLKALEYAKTALSAVYALDLRNHAEVGDIQQVYSATVLDMLQKQEQELKEKQKEKTKADKQKDKKDKTENNTAAAPSAATTNPIAQSGNANISQSASVSSSLSTSSSTSPSTSTANEEKKEDNKVNMVTLCEEAIDAAEESVRVRELLHGFKNSSVKQSKKVLHQLEEQLTRLGHVRTRRNIQDSQEASAPQNTDKTEETDDESATEGATAEKSNKKKKNRRKK